MAENHPYSPDDVAACRSVLIEALTVLGKYRDRIAVVGGWVPELSIPGHGHMGSLDVDLALDARPTSTRPSGMTFWPPAMSPQAFPTGSSASFRATPHLSGLTCSAASIPEKGRDLTR